MSDLQKELETTEAMIEALQSYAEDIRNRMKQPVGGHKFKTWSPVGGDWYVHGSGDVVKSDSSVEFKEFGMERPTKEQAERAAVEMRKFNRLLALRDELCGDDVVDWSKEEVKFFLCCDEENKTWDVQANFRQNNNAVYFTTRESAQRACDMLNSGEVVL